MSRERRWGWSSAIVRLGVMIGAACSVLAIGLLQPGSQAETAVLFAHAAAAYQAGGKLLLSIPLESPDGKTLRGTLHVELLGPDGSASAKAEQDVRQSEPVASYRFELPAAKQPDKTTVRCRLGKKQFEVPLGRILLVKPHETALVSGQEFFAGSTGSIRCEVHGVKSISETVPLPGAEVDVHLHPAKGKAIPLLKERTGADGAGARRRLGREPARAPALGGHSSARVTRSITHLLPTRP